MDDTWYCAEDQTGHSKFVNNVVRPEPRYEETGRLFAGSAVHMTPWGLVKLEVC